MVTVYGKDTSMYGNISDDVTPVICFGIALENRLHHETEARLRDSDFALGEMGGLGVYWGRAVKGFIVEPILGFDLIGVPDMIDSDVDGLAARFPLECDVLQRLNDRLGEDRAARPRLHLALHVPHGPQHHMPTTDGSELTWIEQEAERWRLLRSTQKIDVDKSSV